MDETRRTFREQSPVPSIRTVHEGGDDFVFLAGPNLDHPEDAQEILTGFHRDTTVTRSNDPFLAIEHYLQFPKMHEYVNFPFKMQFTQLVAKRYHGNSEQIYGFYENADRQLNFFYMDYNLDETVSVSLMEDVEADYTDATFDDEKDVLYVISERGLRTYSL